MSLVLLGRAGETKVVTNLADEVVIRVVEVRDGRVLLDISTRIIGRDYSTCDLPLLLAAGAKVRNLGDVRWHATEDGTEGKGTGRHIAAFILEPPNAKLRRSP